MNLNQVLPCEIQITGAHDAIKTLTNEDANFTR